VRPTPTWAHRRASALDRLAFDDLLPLIPRVFEKIAANPKCYLDELERAGHLDA
jgi:hypothetical protein